MIVLKTIHQILIKIKFKKFITIHIKRNRKGIESYKNDRCLGACAEGQISYNYKQALGYGANIFNEACLRNMIDLRLAKLNGLDPVETMVNSELEELSQKDHFAKTSRWIHVDNSLEESRIKKGSTPSIYAGSNNNAMGCAIRGIINY